MNLEAWLWGAVTILMGLIQAYNIQRITRAEDNLAKTDANLSQLRVHIAEKYTTGEDLAHLTQALDDVRKELAKFREALHDAQVSWAKFIGGRAGG